MQGTNPTWMCIATFATALYTMGCMGGGKSSDPENPPTNSDPGASGRIETNNTDKPCDAVNIGEIALDTSGPQVVKPGQAAALRARNLKGQLYLDFGNNLRVPIAVSDSGTGTITAPTGIPTGIYNASIKDSCASVASLTDTSTVTLQILIDATAGDLPIFTGDASLICSDVSFYDQSGIQRSGTRNCSPAQQTSTDKPVCSQDGQKDCIANDSYLAVATSNLLPGVIKAGATVGGITGAFPSREFPLSGPAIPPTTAIPDLGPARAAGEYEYWNIIGERKTLSIARPWPGPISPAITDQAFTGNGALYLPFTVAGDSRLKAENIKKNVEIFGVTGAFTDRPADCESDGQTDCVTTPDIPSVKKDAEMSMHIRAGRSYGGVSGRLKFCKNSARLLAFSWESAIPSAPFVNMQDSGVDNPATPFAPGLDPYDTVDDRNGWSAGHNYNGNPPDKPWGDDYFCSPSDWKPMGDDPTSQGNPAVNCVQADATCVMRDPYTRLYWSKANPTGSAAQWIDAVNSCFGLNYGGFSSGWRLPTQKEALQAYINGITRVSDNFPIFDNPTVNLEFWTASSPATTVLSTNATMAWAIRNSVGNQTTYGKTGVFKAWRCVHD